jgi:hypothetical protein
MRARIAFPLALLAAALLVVELSSLLALRVLADQRGLRFQTFAHGIDRWRALLDEILDHDGQWYQRIDPELGWITIPGVRLRAAAVNAAGIRADKEYAPVPPAGVVRVAAFGDSFVHGDEVTTEEAWATQLERLTPDLEVLNYGVGGYGLDQALLRYRRDGATLAPHVVLIGVIADDVLRGVNVFRPFLAPPTGHVLTKPRFLLGPGDELLLLGNPIRDVPAYRAFLDDPVPVLREIVRHDHYAPPLAEGGPLDALATVRLVELLHATLARPGRGEHALRDGVIDLDAEAGRLALATVRAFASEVRARGATPLVVFLPDRTDLNAHAAGRAPTYRPLLERLAADGVPVADVLPGFDRLAPGWTTEDLLPGSHYSASGNRLVALVLRDELRARRLVARRAP